MEKERTYTRPKTREDMFKLFEQVFYEVRHWFSIGNTKDGLSTHIRRTFKKRPSDLTSEDLVKANTMSLDEWMEFSKGKYLAHLEREAERMRNKRVEPHPFGEVKPLPVELQPIEEVLPGFEPRQTSLDFETVAISDNLGQLIIEVRKIADALGKLARIPDADGYIWVKNE